MWWCYSVMVSTGCQFIDPFYFLDYLKYYQTRVSYFYDNVLGAKVEEESCDTLSCGAIQSHVIILLGMDRKLG